VSQPTARIAIIGGGPGGYEAALVAAQLGAQVTVVETDGLGGACVLTDCVPSKTLIETSGAMAALNSSSDLGIRIGDGRDQPPARGTVDAPRLYGRVKALARAQSADVAVRLAAEGVEGVTGAGWPARGGSPSATGRSPRTPCSSRPARGRGYCPAPSLTASAS
jgi:pyruvate/2-oxoglutarate dehydrogenase complex dihydrolipoamide dehydrogenase (E3) component